MERNDFLMAEAKTFMVEDAQIIFRNFTGEGSQFNAEGRRNFGVIIDPDTADMMAADGWPIKWLQARDEGDTPTPWVKVTVAYRSRAGRATRPPRIVVITSSGRTQLDEKSVDALDYMDFEKVDIFCNAYEWEVGDKSGISAYLKTAFITLREDPLERKYGIGGTPVDDDEGD